MTAHNKEANMIYTGRQRMLNAYKGKFSDRITIAPELWYYYPAKVLGVDMIEFQRNVPFHLALKTVFEKFDCEGWGVVFAKHENEYIEQQTTDKWLNDHELLTTCKIITPKGELTSSSQFSKDEPSWSVEKPIKDIERDLPAYELVTIGGNPDKINPEKINKALEEVGDSYLLEGWLGVPFFDFYAGGREGGIQTAIFDFLENENIFRELKEKYTDFIVRKTRAMCEQTNCESFCIGCSWSCNSLIGPHMWREWDKPVIKAIAEEVHKYNKLLHIHFHGKCIETVADFAELELDCVCPFERPPGGDIKDLNDLKHVAELLKGKTTMNGNIHTVETLIRGNPDDVRREVREVMEAFHGNPRVILGTGDQVGWETPEENIFAMIEEAKNLSL
jgi:uroporphyrinogen decarboxylase-like protein